MKEYIDMSDEQLVACYVKGENEAFDALVERHKNRVYTYIYHQVKNDDLSGRHLPGDVRQGHCHH